MRRLSIVAGLLILLGMISCKRNTITEVEAPTYQEMSTTTLAGSLYIEDNTPSEFKIPIGFTNISDQDRTITFSFSSTTGAASGVQYTAPTSITIPAGRALDTLRIKGLFAGYATPGRKDVLKIKLAGAFPNYAGKDSFMLTMQKFCPIVPATLAGVYDNTREVFSSPYGPYTTEVTSVTPLTATTAEIVVENIFDYGWNPIKFKLDWTDKYNPLITTPTQTGIGDAGTIDSDYDGEDIQVTADTTPGSFNMCDEILVLRMRLGVTGLGFFPTPYVVTLRR